MTDAELQKNRFIALAIDIGAIFAVVVVVVILNIVGSIISNILGSLARSSAPPSCADSFLLRDYIVRRGQQHRQAPDEAQGGDHRGWSHRSDALGRAQPGLFADFAGLAADQHHRAIPFRAA